MTHQEMRNLAWNVYDLGYFNYLDVMEWLAKNHVLPF